MSDANVRVMESVFEAIERRDLPGLLALCTPDVVFEWPPPLPYAAGERGAWAETWIPLQPTPAEIRLDPRVVAHAGDEVVVLWHQRGRSPAGERIDSPVLALYRLAGGKLAHAKMFHFDPAGVARFLASAGS
jgi:ketosteroid isomerase-like protein